jgi:uncharacterized protein YqjF (DUF2071 family)
MLQSWRELTFLHWRLPSADVARRIPSSLAADSFDGSAWVGVTPFQLRNLRLPGLPAVPWISHFPETNCRTYVTAPDGSRGIWFFSLEAARFAAVAGARVAYGLPYFWSRMRVHIEGARIHYQSARRRPHACATTDIEVERGEPVEPGPLEHFLTARYRLFSSVAGRLIYADVEHAPWPLARARVIRAGQTLIQCAGLPRPAGEPLAHYSPGVHVRVGPPRPLR